MHSLIEGVAMAASLYLSASGQNKEVGLLISLALFLHKAPEAAGFGSYLAFANCEFSKRLIFIFIYACASPITAIGGFIAFNSMKTEMTSELNL